MTTKTSKKVLLIGNPNSGKSSLFNLLTGIHQKIANYPGVTTEKKSGRVDLPDLGFELIDLPGTYTLYPNSQDERVVISELVLSSCDFILCVADAGNLARSLLLYTQIADCGIPILMVINMVDELKRRGEEINVSLLEKELDTKIFITNSKTGEGIDRLKAALNTQDIRISGNFFGNAALFEKEKKRSIPQL